LQNLAPSHLTKWILQRISCAAMFQRDLHKKGDRQDIQNYRPILSVFSKPLEKLMYNRLLLFLKRHNIQISEKHGFIKSKFTETASHSFLQSVQ